MSRDTAVVVLLLMGLGAMALWGAWLVAAFLLCTAILTALFAPSDEQRDARRRNRR